MPIRNPFARRPGAPIIQDENSRPGSATGEVESAHPGFQRVDTVGSKASSALSIRSRRSQDTGEYKMSGTHRVTPPPHPPPKYRSQAPSALCIGGTSWVKRQSRLTQSAVVNDSGVYLPPSPIEKEAAWPRRYLSRASSDTRSSSGEIEHFSISRESFDSYRRSFDICAKSPIVAADPAPRGSLDSARFPRLPRSALGERRFGHFGQQPPTPEESFEDVGLNDDNKQTQTPSSHQPTKKRGFFSKFGSDSVHAPEVSVTAAPSQSMSRFLPGRKRGQSGQGSELGAMLSPIMDRPPTATSLQEQEVQS